MAWRRAIHDVRETVRLWHALQANDEAFLRQRVFWRDSFGLPRVMHEMKGWKDATFEIASAPGNPELWALFSPGDTIGPGWYALQHLVNWQLRYHGAFPQMFFTERKTGRDEKLNMRFVPRSLISAIWVQFARAIEGNRTFSQCAHCSRWFEEATEKRSDAKFCTDACRYKAYRRRQVKARELSNNGKSVHEIAAELDSDVKTVKGWISK